MGCKTAAPRYLATVVANEIGMDKLLLIDDEPDVQYSFRRMLNPVEIDNAEPPARRRETAIRKAPYTKR